MKLTIRGPPVSAGLAESLTNFQERIKNTMKTFNSSYKRIVSLFLALILFVGLIPVHSTTVMAADAKKVSLSSLGKKGTVYFGDAKKEGTWWKMNVDGKTAFCVSLGKTCHSGNYYAAESTHKWDEDTKGSDGLYAKIIRWYVVDKKRSQKAFVMAQALIWSVAENRTSKANLTDVIKQVNANISMSDASESSLYKAIFEPEGAWTAELTFWKKTGNSTNYQVLLTVDAKKEEVPYEPKSISDSTYYRQRITVHKTDEDKKNLGGIQFSLSAHNLDDLYSFAVTDRDGTDSDNADEDDETNFSLSGYTKDNGTIAFRMTYKLFTQDYYYFPDDQLEKMSSDDKKAAKKALKEMDLDEGVDFASDLTKASAKKLMEKEMKELLNDISNTYTLTENSTGSNHDIIKDATYAKGVKITLKKANSWERNSDKSWPDTKSGNAEEYSKAYITGITNNYKKATINVVKIDKYSDDKKAHGDAKLDGAQFQMYADSACKTKATVYDSKGKAKTAGTYTVSGEKLTTDYLRSGVTYYLKETKAPTGYTLASGTLTVKVDAKNKDAEYTSNIATQEFGNAPVLGKVAITKNYTDEGQSLGAEEGAKFQVYLAAKGSFDKCDKYERDTITTDDKGYAITKDLYYGQYTVHQVDCGKIDSYLVDDFKVTISENGKTYTYPLNNQIFKAFLKIIKKDGSTEKQVLKPETTYQIYKVTDKGEELVEQEYTEDGQKKKISQFVSDENGEIMTVEALRSATYRIYETDSATGLHIRDTFIEVTINSKLKNYTSFKDKDGNTHVLITLTYTNNETYGKLKLYKTGEMLTGFSDGKFIYEQRLLKGAVFEVYAAEDIRTQDNQGTNWYDNGELVATIATGEGAVFTKECKDITSSSVDEDGTVTVNLPLGKYHVEEKQTLYGYLLPKEGWDVEFNWHNMDEEYVINATDATDEDGTLRVENARAKANIRFFKADRTDGRGIADAEFGIFTRHDIYNVDGEKIVDAGTMLGTMLTDEKGAAFSDMDLPLMMETYSKAVTADGDASVEDQIPVNGTQEAQVSGAKDGNASGTSVDSEAPSVVSGENTSQQKETGKVSEAANETPGKASQADASGNALEAADADGVLIAPAVVLNSGEYYLKELSVSGSYYLTEDEIPFHLEYKDDQTEIILADLMAQNTQTTMTVSKTSITNSEELPGCELQISDQEKHAIVSWTSGDKGSIQLNDKLEELGYRNVTAELDEKGSLQIKGLFHDVTYTLTETRPADGFVTADSIRFQLIEGEEQKTLVALFVGEEMKLHTDDVVRMVDDTTKVEISKTEIVKSKELPGCRLEIKDKKTGKVIEAWTSTKKRHFIEQKLVVGRTYVLTEKRPADGYATADSIDFTIKDTGEVQSIGMKDETTKIRLIKLADDSGQGLPGAKFDVLDSKGKKVMSFTSTADGYDITGKLIVGETYTFKETEAPKGYKLAAPVRYTVKDTGDVQKVSVTDEKNDKPHHPQTGGRPFPAVPGMLWLGSLVAGIFVSRRKRVRV